MKTLFLPLILLLTTHPHLTPAHPTHRHPDPLCKTRCATIHTTFTLISPHLTASTPIPHNLLSDLYTQQSGILAAGCDYNTCLVSPVHPRVEDGFRPNDHAEEARGMSCQELRGALLGAFRGGFGKSVRGMKYVCTQALVDVMVWQVEMARREGGRACGGLSGGGSGAGDWVV